MRLIVLGWNDADWDTATEDRMVRLVHRVLNKGLEATKSVPPDTAELLPTFTAAEIGVALGITTEDTEV